MTRTGTLAFLSGVLLVLHSATLPPLPLLVLIIPLLAGLSRAGPRWRLLGWFVGGVAWAMIRAHVIMAEELDRDLEQQTLTVRGQVISLPMLLEDGVRFDLRLTESLRVGDRAYPSPGRIRLSWYRQPPEIRPGQYWQLDVRLRRPHGFVNPGGFDYEGWLVQQRIRTVGYVVATPRNHYLGITRGMYIDRLRHALRAAVNDVPDLHYRGLLIALTLGDRSQTSRAQKTTLVNTGTYHLLAISGLHISLVAGLFYLALLKLWPWTGRGVIALPAPRVAAVTAILAAAAYSLLSGFAIPAQRAWIMLMVVMSAVFSGRHYAPTQVLSMALLLVLIFDPLAAIDPGFWLSFGAILVLACGMSHRIGTGGLWWQWGRAQYVVFLGLMPVSLLWFQQYALHGMIANIVAIPWVSLVTTPLALAGVGLMAVGGLPGRACMFLADMSLHLIWLWLQWLQQWPAALWQQAIPSPAIMMTGVAGALLLLLPPGLHWRWLGLVWLLPMLLPVPRTPEPGAFWFTLLDVGQGLAAVIHTHNHALVYDTGGRFSDSFDAGAAVVIPYLRQAGMASLDQVIISHGDNDHIGGAHSLLEAYPDTPVLSSVSAPFAHPYWETCVAGQEWQWDGVRFQILHPARDESSRDNNQSCVLRISTSQYAVLVPGDIEQEAEHRLLSEHAADLPAAVLVAPHHGSRTSSSPAFISAVNPQVVLYATGYRNRYRHPNQDIMQRYAQRGIRSHDTSRDGAVLIRIDQSGMTAATWRRVARRFWHARD